MKAFDDDLRWKVIYHQFLLCLSADLTANILFVSKRFMYNVRAIYRWSGDVTRLKRKGRQRLLSGMLGRQVDNYILYFISVDSHLILGEARGPIGSIGSQNGSIDPSGL